MRLRLPPVSLTWQSARSPRKRGELMASIERWSSNRWRAHWRTPEGKSQSKVFDRKVDAQPFTNSLEHSKTSGTYVDPLAGKQTFLAFADEWAASQDWKATSRES